MFTRRAMAGALVAAGATSAVAQESSASPAVTSSTIKENEPPAATQAELSLLDAQSTETGRAPLVRDKASWAGVVEAFHRLYGPIPVTEGRKPQERTSGVDPKSLTYPATFDTAAQSQFRYNHVEVLLSQAADLLDRCLATRDLWTEKSSRLASLALEIADFLQNDVIHEEEIVAGVYTVPYLVSYYDELANIHKAQSAANAALWTDHTLKQYYTLDKVNEGGKAAQTLAWLSVIPNYELPNVGNPRQNVLDGVPMAAAPRAIGASAKLAFRNIWIENFSLNGQLAYQKSTKAAFDAAKTGAAEKARWDHADISFKRRRTQVARDIADFKVRLASTPNGAFNYAEQVERYRKRFDRDLKDAVARVTAARDGMKLLYNYTNSLPAALDNGVKTGAAPDAVALFEELLLWVREAIAFLVAFGQREQSFTETISLSQLMGSSQFQSARTAGLWRFTIPESMFNGLSHVRVRGVNVFAKGSYTGFWKCKASVPPTSKMTYASGGSATIDQRSIPTLRLGKVGKRSDTPFLEVFGVTSLRNASPVGAWELTASDKSTSGDARSKIEDLEIDVDVVVVP